MLKYVKSRWFVSLFLAVLIAVALYRQYTHRYPRHELFLEYFDTFIEVIYYCDPKFSIDETGLVEKIQNELAAANRSFSIYDTLSWPARFNQGEWGNSVILPDPLRKVIAFSLKLSGESSGAFDITVHPLVKLWDFRKAKIPTPLQIEETLKHVGFENLNLVADSVLIRSSSDINIDLGAVAKGFIADSLADYIQHTPGMIAGLINVGGNIKTFGKKPVDGGRWKIGVRNPRANDSIWCTLEINDDEAVATSGDYERYFLGNDGHRYSHIIDPLTGYPVQFTLVGVTVTGHSAMVCDGLSTAIFALGINDGVRFMKTYYPQFRYLLIENINGELHQINSPDL